MREVPKVVLHEGSPEEAGVSPAAVERILVRGQEWIDDGIHSAIVLLAARRGVIFLHQAFGVRSENDLPGSLPLDTIYPVASITKVFTSTLVMTLVEDGLIGLTRPVQEYIPEFQGKRAETVLVHHLMTHTAGIDDEAVFAAIDAQEGIEIDLPPREPTCHPDMHRWIHIGIKVSLAEEPGTVMMYSSFGVQLLGEIVRRVSGQSIDAFARDKIFDPLKMVDTFYSLPDELQPRVVLRPESAPYAEELNSYKAQERPSPSGGMYSTAMDTAIFAQMFLNRGTYGDRRILSPVSVSAMTSNRIPGTEARFFDAKFPEASWGFGWSINAPYKGEAYGEPLLSSGTYMHGGGGGTFLWVDPRDEIVGIFFSVVLKNREGDQPNEPVTCSGLFMNMVASAVGDEG